MPAIGNRSHARSLRRTRPIQHAVFLTVPFRSLHEAPEAFVIANVWDGGSARMMAALGFPALATSSGASAGTGGVASVVAY
jgi:hypothetical protein